MAKPTLESLARELGVSRQTVANAINNPSIVRESTRERVLAAVDASGYRPSVLGRALRTQRSMDLALRLNPVLDGINGAILDRFVHALAQTAQQSGYRITLFTAADAAEEVARLQEMHRVSAIDGCVLTDTTFDDERPDVLQRAGLPTVAFGRPWGRAGEARHAWVDIDGSAGTQAATHHLRAAGHERVGFLGWAAGSGVGDDRRDGWAQGCDGLPGAAGLALSREDGAPAGASGAAELIERGATAIVCASDSLGLGALSLVRGRGLDVDVVGFDDTPVAEALGMSSVHQPVEEAAALLMAALLAGLGGETAPEPTGVLLTPRLVVRHQNRT